MPKKLLITLLAFSLFLFARPALAENDATPSMRNTWGSIRKEEPKISPRPVLKRALEETRLRACEAKKLVIRNRMGSLVRMVENMEKVFDSIAERVKKFYQEKVVPSGKTVANYDALVADIAAKKATLDADLVAVQGTDTTFDCGGEDPKGQLTQFRENMQKLKTDLKNYRTSIKNLIVAVKRTAPKESPKPTVTPSPLPTP